METGTNKVIQSVNRAIEIIRCFENKEELGVTEISKMVRVHKSTTFGLISTLEANKLLEKNENTGKYRLGLELFKLGTKVSLSLRRIAIPYMERLVKIYQETVNLVVMDGLSVMYLEKIESNRSINISTLVGGRLPLHCTAVGKAIISNLPVEDLHGMLSKMELKKFTGNTLCDAESLIESLEKARGNGYAEENEELQIGLSCIASPIFNHYDYPFAAISLSCPTHRMNENFRKEVGGSLKQSSQEISRMLGCSKSQ